MTEADTATRFAAAVFDLDGLLVDSESLWHQAEIEVFCRYGVPLTVELCQSTKGRFVGEVAVHWHDRFGWVGPSPAAVADEVTDRMAVLLTDRVELKAGARQAIEWCGQRGIRLAVASSSGHRLIEAALGRHGLRPHFEVVSSAEDVKSGKPDPAVYLAAASALRLAPQLCVALEDSAVGTRSAVAAGMGCVLVPEGVGPERVEVVVDAILGSLWELPAAWEDVERAFYLRSPANRPGA